MPVTKLDVRTADGTMDVYLHAPEPPEPAEASAGPLPAVVFFADAGGVRPTTHAMAERLAASGYLVALPNVFYRAGAYEPFDFATVFTDPAERARLGAVVRLADAAAVNRDTGALLAALAELPEANADKVGVVGYCLGGRMAFGAAGAHPERIAAAASIHGGGLATDEPDSPHRQASKIRATVYFAVADNDRNATPESQAILREALDAANVRYELDQYPGAYHGFAVPDLPTYDKEADEKHRRRLEELFAGCLAAGG